MMCALIGGAARPMAPGFVETNLLIALGISADAAALTLCDFEANARWRRALVWVSAVTLTHSLLPFGGLAVVWFAAEHLPGARAPLYAAGAAVLVTFLVAALRESWRTTRAPGALAAREGPAAFLAKIVLVSLDAALIGPSKGAATSSWNGGDLVTSCGLSVVFVGAILSASAGVAWLIAHRLRPDPARVGTLRAIARVGQYGVMLPVSPTSSSSRW